MSVEQWFYCVQVHGQSGAIICIRRGTIARRLTQPKAYRLKITTAHERALVTHSKLSRNIRDAVQKGEKTQKNYKRLVKLEQEFGIVSSNSDCITSMRNTTNCLKGHDPVLEALAAPLRPSKMTQPGRKKKPKKPKPQKKDSNRVVRAGRVSRPKAKRSQRAKEESSNLKNNMNFLPMAFNRLGDRTGKEPTPEPEVDDSLGLEA